MTATYVYYRNAEYGYNEVRKVDGKLGLSDNIDFSAGYCFFTSGGVDYRIPVSALVAITHEMA